ncbi:8813_t:CDS:2, partial [Racocetra fulgida]
GDLYCKESTDSYGNGYVYSNVKGTNGTCIYGYRSDCDCRKGTCDKKASPLKEQEKKFIDRYLPYFEKRKK